MDLVEMLFNNAMNAEGGGGGGGDVYPVFSADYDKSPIEYSCDKTFSECQALCTNDMFDGQWFCVFNGIEDGEPWTSAGRMADASTYITVTSGPALFYYLSDGTFVEEQPE